MDLLSMMRLFWGAITKSNFKGGTNPMGTFAITCAEVTRTNGFLILRLLIQSRVVLYEINVTYPFIVIIIWTSLL